MKADYDRHDYLAEKRDAFEKLANLIDRIVNPPADNVVTIRNSARGRRSSPQV
jgi:hypothetical protein